MSRRSRWDAAEQRRAQLAELLPHGFTQRELAGALHCSLGTVNRDLRILRRRWRKVQLEKVEQAMLDDLHRLELALHAIWPRVEAGDVHAVDTLISLVMARARLLCYEPPAQIKAKAGGPLGQAISSQVVYYLPPPDPAEEEVSEAALGL